MKIINAIRYCILYCLFYSCSSSNENKRLVDVLQLLLKHTKFNNNLILSPKSDYSHLYLPVSTLFYPGIRHYNKITLEFGIQLNGFYSDNMVLFKIVNKAHTNTLTLLLSESDINENCYHVHIMYSAHSDLHETLGSHCFMMKDKVSLVVSIFLDENKINIGAADQNVELIKLDGPKFKKIIFQQNDFIWLFNEPGRYFGRFYGSVYSLMLRMKISNENENLFKIDRKKRSIGLKMEDPDTRKYVPADHLLTRNKESSQVTEKNRSDEDIRSLLFRKYNIRDCTVLKNIRFNSKLDGKSGDQGDKGDQGPKGIKGDSGTKGRCDFQSCQPKYEKVKGDKGDQGTCNADQCLSVKGDKGEWGIPGLRGFKGEKGEPAQIDLEMIKKMTLSIIQKNLRQKNIVDLLRGPKGARGESCGCNQNDGKSSSPESRSRARRSRGNQGPIQNDIYRKTINSGYGSLLFQTRSDLEEVAYKLPLGAVVFVVAADVFLVKIDEINQIWRIISLESKKWVIPKPKVPISTPTTPMFPYDRKINSMALHLVALSLPTTGDLRSSLIQPGGYTGAHFKCQQAGKINGIAKLMHPLINTNSFNFKYSLNQKYMRNKIYNARGELLANDFLSLLSPTHVLPNEILDFNLNPISTNKISPCIWMGQEVDANRIEDYQFSSRGKCNSWMSRHPQKQGLAVSLSQNNNKKLKRALYSPENIKEIPCSKQCFILCLQTVP